MFLGDGQGTSATKLIFLGLKKSSIGRKTLGAGAVILFVALALALFILTCAIKIEGMALDVKIVMGGYRVTDGLYAGIAKFEDLVTLRTNEVIVLSIAVGFFIKREVLPEVMLPHKVALRQDIQGIVHRGAADLEVLGFHVYV
jgi:hypothetical protein